MVRHLIFSTSFGKAVVVYRQSPFSIVKIVLPRSNRKMFIESSGISNYGKPGSHQKALLLSGLLIHYFNGKQIDVPGSAREWMDTSGLTPLQKSVLTATFDIPYGKLSSYKKIAEAVGRPKAYRFVGTTLAKNRFPIIIPCHRVIRSDGSLGRFAGGEDLKQKLIELEAKYI